MVDCQKGFRKKTKLQKLKMLSKRVDWTNKSRRSRLCHVLRSNIIDARCGLRTLLKIFRHEEIEYLLVDTIRNCSEDDAMELVQMLIRIGYKDKPELDEDGNPVLRRETGLIAAFDNFLSDIVPELFKIYNRFDLNYMYGENDYSHFLVACISGCKDAVEEFLKFGQDPNVISKEDDCSTALLLALAIGNAEIFELLLKYGADPNIASSDGWTPLRMIIVKNDIGAFARILFEHSQFPVDVNNTAVHWGRQPLHTAVARGLKIVSELLLKNGADPNFIDSDGMTALLSLCMENRGVDLAKIIFEFSHENHQPVQLDIRDDVGRTALHYVVDNNDREMLEFLLRKGADPNLQDQDGSTPLHMICHGIDEKKCLMKHYFNIISDVNQKVDFDVRDNLGRTVLELAVASLMPHRIDVLLDNGADLSTFVFPDVTYFNTNQILWHEKYNFQLCLASGAMEVAERLEKRGYELSLNDALTLMEFFAEHKLFEKSTDFEKFQSENFVKSAKDIMINPSLSLYELIHVSPKDAAKLVKYKEYSAYDLLLNLDELDKIDKEACVRHLSEKLSKEFFRTWALDYFLALTRYKLPIEICDIIISKLKNKDLYTICRLYKSDSEVTDQKKKPL